MRNLFYICCAILGVLCGMAARTAYDYAVTFDVKHKTPSHVVYQTHTGLGAVERTGMAFKVDPAEPASPSPSNYSGSGYDLGHLCPAEDMSWSEEAMRSTFLTSNCAPQNPTLNRGDWKELEMLLRNHSARGPPMTIHVGVIFPPDSELKTIGPEHVGVPIYFWKVAYEADGTLFGSWLFPNETGRNLHPDAYAIPLKKLENMLGYSIQIKEMK